MAQPQPPTVVMGGATQQPLNAGQIVYVSGTRTYTRVNSNIFAGLGITQIVLGGVLFILQILCNVFYIPVLYFTGWGYFTAPMVIVAGAFSIVTGRQKTKCPLVTCMVMSILSAVFIIAILIMCLISIIIWYWYLIVGILYFIFALAEMVIAIITSVYCCKAFGDNGGQQMMVPLQYVAEPQPSGAQMTTAPHSGPQVYQPGQAPVGSATIVGPLPNIQGTVIMQGYPSTSQPIQMVPGYQPYTQPVQMVPGYAAHVQPVKMAAGGYQGQGQPVQMPPGYTGERIYHSVINTQDEPRGQVNASAPPVTPDKSKDTMPSVQ